MTYGERNRSHFTTYNDFQKFLYYEDHAEEMLKPCPFCGGKAKLHERLNRPFYAGVCKNTKCPGHNLSLLHYTKVDAVDCWNRRA